MNLDAFQLEGKSILVTGSNRGIGRAIALRLGQSKANVGVTYSGSNEKSKTNAEEVAHEIEKSGGRALLVSLDVGSEENCKAAVDQMVKNFGGLYGLVNNSGVSIDQLSMRFKMEDCDRLMNINLKGAFQMTKQSLRYLMKNDESSVVNMSSVVGLSGNAGQVPYSASKAGLIGMTKSLALEVASRHVRVNAVAPGFIETDMTEALNAAQKQEISARIPLNSLGKADDIAWATMYLLSPLSRYVTGQILSVNGGLYM